MPLDDTVSAVVERLRETLEADGVVYAFGGALALAAWSEPRATADVDVILWLDPEREVERAIGLVRTVGVQVDEDAARGAVARRRDAAGRPSHREVGRHLRAGP